MGKVIEFTRNYADPTHDGGAAYNAARERARAAWAAAQEALAAGRRREYREAKQEWADACGDMVIAEAEARRG